MHLAVRSHVPMLGVEFWRSDESTTKIEILHYCKLIVNLLFPPLQMRSREKCLILLKIIIY